MQVTAAIFGFATSFAYGAAASCWGQNKCEGDDCPEHRARVSGYPDFVDRRRAHHSAPAVVATASVP
ncbi:MAG: hypothetical protein ACPG4T_21635, partial [Nannocystaceae bacterium]